MAGLLTLLQDNGEAKGTRIKDISSFVTDDAVYVLVTSKNLVPFIGSVKIRLLPESLAEI